MIWIIILLTVFQLYLASLVCYLLLLAAASWKVPRSAPSIPPEAYRRFLILIPAHNEEYLLPDLLQSLSRMNYPSSLYSIHVVADNCTDRTAEIAVGGDAQVHVRKDLEHIGKGFALNWLMERVLQAESPYDAVLFLDADSIVSPNFLQVMSAHLGAGERVIQGFYTARDPDLSWAGSLRYAALAVLHFLRPQGRMRLGTSAGLKGNGMVFAAEAIRSFTWSASVTEDIELHMALLLSGERVTFAPDAVVWGEMPSTLANSASQHRRWEQGRKQLAGRYIPRLISAAVRELRKGRPGRALLLMDAVMEFLEPPFSILFGGSVFGLALSALIWIVGGTVLHWNPIEWPGWLSVLNVLIGLALLVGQAVYLFAGLRSVSAPKQVYLNLVHAPRLVVWKIWQMLFVSFGQPQNSWVRTKRNGR